MGNIDSKIDSNLINVSIDFTESIDMLLKLPKHLQGKSEQEIKKYFKDFDLDDLYKLSYKSDKYGFKIEDMDIKPFKENDKGNNLPDDLLKNGFEILHTYSEDNFTLVSTNKVHNNVRYIIMEFDTSYTISIYSTVRQSVCVVASGKDEGFTIYDKANYSEDYNPTDVENLTYSELIDICNKQGYNII